MRRVNSSQWWRDARRGAFDVVLVWRFDRFARSIEQLVLALAEFRTLRIDFVSSQEALDTSTPMGKAMFTIVGAIAELERNVIRERIMAGLEHARSRGTKSGRQIGRPVVVFDRAQVVKLRAAGRSWREMRLQRFLPLASELHGESMRKVWQNPRLGGRNQWRNDTGCWCLIGVWQTRWFLHSKAIGPLVLLAKRPNESIRSRNN